MKNFTLNGHEMNIARYAVETANDMTVDSDCPEDLMDHRTLLIKLGGQVDNNGYSMAVPSDTQPIKSPTTILVTDAEFLALSHALTVKHEIDDDTLFDNNITANLFPHRDEYCVLDQKAAHLLREELGRVVDNMSRIRLLMTKLGIPFTIR